MLYNTNIIKILQFTMMHCHKSKNWLACGQCKNRTKKHSEFKNNTVNHTIFLAWLACWLGL